MSAIGPGANPRPVALVVDDEPQIRTFLTLALSDAGFGVCAVEDGVAALAALQELRPAVIVTDLMMPRLDGWELCRRLRTNSETAAIPLIVISAARDTDTPGDLFLPKPFELDALLAAMRTLTGVASRRDADSANEATAERSGVTTS